MPSSDKSPEATAIDAAYQEHIGALFKILIENLIRVPSSHETDQQCVDRFVAGLHVAKRARQLALRAVPPVATAAVSKRAASKSVASKRVKTKESRPLRQCPCRTWSAPRDSSATPALTYGL